MSDTAEWANQIAGGQMDEKWSIAPRATLLSGLIVLFGLGASAWLYFGEAETLSRLLAPSGAAAGAPGPQTEAVLFEQFEHWAFWMAVGSAGIGTGCLVAMAASLMSWRRAWRGRVQEWDQGWRKTAARLQSQLANSRRSEEQLLESRTSAQERVVALESANAELQAELDRLKRTGKTLAQQQQALASSKTVLELHVQASTQDLQRLQRRYEHILNSAGEGICGLDGQGRTIFANPAAAKLTGWTPEELVGQTEQGTFGGTRGDGQDAFAGRNSGEGVFYRKDGSCFPVEFVKTCIEENDSPVRAVLVFKDITERKKVEETLASKAAELARSNAELEQFAFVASHDLQEPLRKIQAFGDRLKAKCEGAIAAEARDYLERMQSASARMRTLIDDLLAFSRVMRSAEPFVPVNLGVIAREVLGDLEVRIEKSRARVEVGELPTIEADPMQMRQLLLNLIGNSLKFQLPGAVPVVKVESRIFGRDMAADQAGTPEQLCEIRVQDNGIGFEESYTERIFAVFQRLHGRTEYEGTGVGLAVCRRIAERHHGTIVAQSKLGEGATFIVTLPVSQPKPRVLP
jgi:PAS domain S-box-containing protein